MSLIENTRENIAHFKAGFEGGPERWGVACNAQADAMAQALAEGEDIDATREDMLAAIALWRAEGAQ